MGLLDQSAGGGQGPVVPGLAQAAAAAGAPAPGAEAGASTGAAPAPPQAAGLPPGNGAPPAASADPAGPPAGGGAAQDTVDVGEEPSTPEEQQEYERAMAALTKVLYENEKSSNAVVNQIDPEDKIGSTAKVSMLFMRQLDEQIDMDESIVAQMTQETVTRIIELAETRHQMDFDKREAQLILSSTWEGVAQMFGADQEQHSEMMQGISPDLLPQLKEQHEAALNG